MKIVLYTYCTSPECNGDCDYAVLDVTADLLKVVRSRVGLARQAYRKDHDLLELYFWDNRLDFYDAAVLASCEEVVAAATAGDEEAQAAAVEAWSDALANGHAVLPDAVDLTAHTPQRADCAQMIVQCSPTRKGPEFEIAWVVIPKHLDSYVTTCGLPLAALEDYCGKEPLK